MKGLWTNSCATMGTKPGWVATSQAISVTVKCFFNLKMLEYMQPTPKDQDRTFGAIERELIYYRDKKRCRAPSCSKEVPWGDAEFHHVKPHSDGGATIISNGALVCRECHPLSAGDVRRFADHFWRSRRSD